MQELVDFIARALAQQPEEVRVELEGERKVVLSVSADDLGRLIGRRGRTAKAIRTLLRASHGADLEITGDEDEDAHSEDEEPEGSHSE